MKKILSIILALSMVLTMLPTVAFATETDGYEACVIASDGTTITYYETLPNAVAAAKDTDTVKMLSDSSSGTDSTTLMFKSTTTIDFNGYQVKTNNSQVENGVTLTMMDSRSSTASGFTVSLQNSGTLNWNGGNIKVLALASSSSPTTNLSFEPTDSTEIRIMDNLGNAVSTLTETVKFITLGDDMDYDDTNFNIKTFSNYIIVQSGNDYYVAPTLSADIELAEDAQYDSKTTATVTFSNLDLDDGIFVKTATIYAQGTSSDVVVGTIDVENGVSTYTDVEIDLTDEDIILSGDDGLDVDLYIEFTLADDVNIITDDVSKKMAIQTFALDKHTLVFDISGTQYVYDGTEKSIAIDSTESKLTKDDFNITYYEVDTDTPFLNLTLRTRYRILLLRYDQNLLFLIDKIIN
ncbi:MAG: hypothetical protein R3Y09_14070 [Clostridia bacterium]